ncbi:hypothetical protein [Halioxenophilus aromaticivorans]|uniref:DNA gyrase subunit B n=1 Tax=Halioxenophilus aromaticivorans TaxID=1306992 RepID=A0AAV3U117_9ALTE
MSASWTKVCSAVITLLALLYPAWLYFNVQSQGIAVLALGLIIIATGRLLVNRHQASAKEYWILIGVITLCVIAYASHNAIYLKFYPAVMNFSVAASFALSLTKEQSLIEYFATRFSTNTPHPPQARAYMRKLTLAWAIFLTGNGLAALCTALFTSTEIWALYNCVISYLIMALFFAVELLFRQFYRRRWPDPKDHNA